MTPREEAEAIKKVLKDYSNADYLCSEENGPEPRMHRYVNRILKLIESREKKGREEGAVAMRDIPKYMEGLEDGIRKGREDRFDEEMLSEIRKEERNAGLKKAAELLKQATYSKDEIGQLLRTNDEHSIELIEAEIK